MNWMKALAAVGVSAVLAACGGGGGSAGTVPGSLPPGPTAQTIDVVSSSLQVGGGGDQVTITAVVKDAGNVSMPSIAVTFATDTGTLTSADATTNLAGIATATLSAGANKTNRVMTVTVSSGSVSGSVKVEVTGTKLTYTGSTTVPLGDTTPVSVKATDSKGTAISGLPITVSSQLNNGLSATSVTTDGQGIASLVYTATKAGADVVTFSSAGVSATANITISGENFVFVSPAPGTAIDVGVSKALTVRYLSGGAPQVGKTVNFAATSGTLSAASAVTDASGGATVSIVSSSASPATVQASLAAPLVAQATLPIVFVAKTPAKIVLQIQPTAIGPNTVGTTQQADVQATVTDANGNPVQGKTVNFNRLADPSGGNLSAASKLTDASGQATVQYIAGPKTTASNGVVIQAVVADVPAVNASASLTVSQSALFIALGTGNTISNIDEQTYKKDWVVYVTDANGVAVPNITLTMKVLPLSYGKGTLVFADGGWGYNPADVVFCRNEDRNYNGVLDAGEDDNGSGTLEPGNVISVTPGTVKTDATGRATLSLIYAESYAPWVQVTLRAETLVAGTEFSKGSTFIVSGSTTDFNKQDTPPAGQVSPFGVNGCASPN
jgi:hypothetical protein